MNEEPQPATVEKIVSVTSSVSITANAENTTTVVQSTIVEELPHGQAVPIPKDEEEFFPGHPARTATAEYRATHEHLVKVLDTPCEICGVRNSKLHDPAHNKHNATAVETHHWPIQREYTDACDYKKVALDYGKYVVDQESFLKFVDSPYNMKVLCLPGDSLVLMANGSQQKIENIKKGDKVIGHDLLPHTVTDTMFRHYEGNLIGVDGQYMTPEHPILTRDGWVDAAILPKLSIIFQVGITSHEFIGEAYSTALLHVPRVITAGWRSINHTTTLPYNGNVYNLAVEGSESFIAGNIAVHNCSFCHRDERAGIHHALPNDWIIHRYLLDGYILTDTRDHAAADLIIDQKIVDDNVPMNERI